MVIGPRRVILIGTNPKYDAGKTRQHDYHRKGHGQDETAHKRTHRNGEQDRSMQQPSPQPVERRQHNCQNSGLHADKNGFEYSGILIGDIDHAERQHGDGARQNKKNAGNNTAAHPVQQPAKINGQLLRLWAGKQHAKIQCMQEPPFADPFHLGHHKPVHDGNLAGRTTKAEQADLEPDPDSHCERDCPFLQTSR